MSSPENRQYRFCKSTRKRGRSMTRYLAVRLPVVALPRFFSVSTVRSISPRSFSAGYDVFNQSETSRTRARFEKRERVGTKRWTIDFKPARGRAFRQNDATRLALGTVTRLSVWETCSAACSIARPPLSCTFLGPELHPVKRVAGLPILNDDLQDMVLQANETLLSSGLR